MKTTHIHKNLAATRFIAVAAVLACALGGPVSAQMSGPPDPLSITGPNPADRYRDISIEQNLDAQVPLDTEFVDEQGQTVKIGDFLGDRPAILVMVYYECPMLCIEVLNGVEIALKGMKYGIGEDYDVITISIDPGETPELARKKKNMHLGRLNREGAEEGWHFLTTPDTEAIDAVADTVGFRYVYDAATDQYAHAAGIMILTPEGKVSRYFYGIQYIPKHLEFGLVEASGGKVGSVVDRFVLLCYAYDVNAGAYNFEVLVALRIAATLLILGFALLWGTTYWRWRRNKNKNDGQPC